ncbi:hypothetical protein VTK56DRAFT_3337 [Thermocarpiscus australiensis]
MKMVSYDQNDLDLYWYHVSGPLCVHQMTFAGRLSHVVVVHDRDTPDRWLVAVSSMGTEDFHNPYIMQSPALPVCYRHAHSMPPSHHRLRQGRPVPGQTSCRGARPVVRPCKRQSRFSQGRSLSSRLSATKGRCSCVSKHCSRLSVPRRPFLPSCEQWLRVGQGRGQGRAGKL